MLIHICIFLNVHTYIYIITINEKAMILKENKEYMRLFGGWKGRGETSKSKRNNNNAMSLLVPVDLLRFMYSSFYVF